MTRLIFTSEVYELEKTLGIKEFEYNLTRPEQDQIRYILMKPVRDKILQDLGLKINDVTYDHRHLNDIEIDDDGYSGEEDCYDYDEIFDYED